MLPCTNCGVEFDGKFFSGGGLFTCPECFRLQQFSQKQAELLSRSDERAQEDREVELQDNKYYLRSESKATLRSKIKTARTLLNAGLLDDAIRRAAEASEAADAAGEDDDEILLDISSIFICIAAQTNKPRLAQEHIDSFPEKVSEILVERFAGTNPITENLIEIPSHWEDALKFLPQNGASRDVISDIKKNVVAQIRTVHELYELTSSQEKVDSKLHEMERKAAIGPALRLATVSAAHASVFAARLWNGIKLGLVLGFLSSLFLAGLRFFKGPMAGGVGLTEMVVFGMTAGIIIGILAKLRS